MSHTGLRKCTPRETARSRPNDGTHQSERCTQQETMPVRRATGRQPTVMYSSAHTACSKEGSPEPVMTWPLLPGKQATEMMLASCRLSTDAANTLGKSLSPPCRHQCSHCHPRQAAPQCSLCGGTGSNQLVCCKHPHSVLEPRCSHPGDAGPSVKGIEPVPFHLTRLQCQLHGGGTFS